MDFQLLKKINNDNILPPMKKVQDLLKRKPYSICNVEKIKTRIGVTIPKLTMIDPLTEEKVRVFIHERYMAYFTDDRINAVANGELKLVLVHQGPKEDAKGANYTILPAEEISSVRKPKNKKIKLNLSDESESDEISFD